MSGLVVLQGLLLAIEALAASSGIVVLAWLATLAYPRRAGARHLIWLTAACALPILPLLTAILPAHFAFTLEAAPPRLPDGIARGVAPAIHSSFDGASVLVGLMALWALGLCGFAVQSVVAALGLARLRRNSSPYRAAGLEHVPCEIRLAPDNHGPMTWGVIRPIVLLPAQAAGWQPVRVRTVLAHELAHVRRRDSLAQAIAMAACALYWPNPLVWLAARALRRDAEIAADDAVIASGIKPSDYADALVCIARDARGRTGALAMASPPTLSHRVSSILSPTPIRTGVTAMDALKIAAAGAAATAALALARPGITQPSPAPPAPPAAPPTAAQSPVEVLKLLDDDAPAGKARPGAAHKGAHVLIIRPDAKAGAEGESVIDSAKIAADVRKALADAHIEETVAKQLAESQKFDQAELAHKLAELEPRIQKAIADAHIEETIARSMAQAQPRIDAAIAKANAAAAKAREQAAEKNRQQ